VQQAFELGQLADQANYRCGVLAPGGADQDVGYTQAITLLAILENRGSLSPSASG
jgi:hypothetical protein